jgi:CRP-like cAMP-binding protein
VQCQPQSLDQPMGLKFQIATRRETRNQVENQLLAALPEEDYKNLLPKLETISLPQGKSLHEPCGSLNYVYFLNNTLVSLLSFSEEGTVLDVATVGNEGVIGIPIFLETNVVLYQATVQIPGEAVRIRADLLKQEFNRGGSLQKVLLRYTHALVNQIFQSAVCNRFHTVEERLCRWLLIAHDTAKSDTLQLTQEFLSQMLGTRRAGVTVAIGILQNAGLIRHNRGQITIIDKANLESASCECYGLIRSVFDHFLNF